MHIWFGTTTLHFKEYKHYYLNIRAYLLASNHVLTDDWLGNHGKWLEDNPYATRDIKDIYQKVLKAIDGADISIIEFTVPNFSTSHQITYSLSKKKPTLVLRLKKDNTFKDSYLEALTSPYLSIVEYTEANYKEQIADFIAALGYDTDYRRYNIMLTKRHKHYLDEEATRLKVSKSYLVRRLIDQELLAVARKSKG